MHSAMLRLGCHEMVTRVMMQRFCILSLYLGLFVLIHLSRDRERKRGDLNKTEFLGELLSLALLLKKRMWLNIQV